jgi:hypothetical protein
MRQLKQWYPTLDKLLARKSDIELALYLTLRDLLSSQVDMVPWPSKYGDVRS